MLPGLLTVSELKAIQRALRRVKRRVGNRQMLSLAWCDALAERLRARIAEIRELRILQCTLFEKHKEQNWLVAAHQDLMLPGAGEHSRDHDQRLRLRRGTTAELQRVIAVRCHVDVCAESDGPLRTKPGTHKVGVLRANEVALRSESVEWKTHVAGAGDVLLMRPLTVHASSKSTGNSRRRVLHFVFA
jgi:ectoine hydroxylase-related dioxygenase (phytanoyl-CoA dioxygenase family)